jgi:hypothetical protein
MSADESLLIGWMHVEPGARIGHERLWRPDGHRAAAPELRLSTAALLGGGLRQAPSAGGLLPAWASRLPSGIWLRLSRLDGQTPTALGRAALTGLRLLPPLDPSRPALVPAVYAGLVHFAEGLARRGSDRAALDDEITYLGQALLRHGDAATALAAYAEVARRFPSDPVAIAGHGHALLELEGAEAALPVLRAGVAAHPDDLALCKDLTDPLIQAGDLPAAERQLAGARRIEQAGRSTERGRAKIRQLAQRLDRAREVYNNVNALFVEEVEPDDKLAPRTPVDQLDGGDLQDVVLGDVGAGCLGVEDDQTAMFEHGDQIEPRQGRLAASVSEQPVGQDGAFVHSAQQPAGVFQRACGRA